ncbi:MAG: hypothetical protein HYR75_01815 [Gemmatimonadetes bacterium]|nr:hypothetical protein [Gemmatimonadota bacterium]MBI3569401.1 hypothetical protein [Gemmatimonadota bacterium]
MATMTLDELVVQLRSAYGADLLAVVLYGSAAGGERHAGHSDENVLVLVREVRPLAVHPAGAASRAWSKTGNRIPLTLTEAEWRSSVDVFAMEHADIKERHRVLWAADGFDPFAGISVSRADLRQQLEYETMATLLRVRAGMFATSDDPARRIELLAASAGQVLVVFRALARLIGEAPDANSEALCRRIAAHAGFDATPFEAVLAHRRKQTKLTAQEASAVMTGYHAGLERLVAFLDTLPVSE